MDQLKITESIIMHETSLTSVEQVLSLSDTLDVDQGPSTTIPSRITKLMIQAMGASRSRFTGKTALDFGCGGGHLSLAALEFGASEVIGIDCDASCAKTFQQNFKKLHFENKQFEFIAAEGLHDLPNKLKNNVDIIVSNPAQIVLPHEHALPNYGYDGPEGRNMLDHLLDRFQDVLTDNGIAFISNTCFSNPAKTISSLAHRGFKATVVNEGMIDLYEQMYDHELLEHLKSLPYLGDNDFVEDSSGRYKFRVFCFRIERQIT